MQRTEKYFENDAFRKTAAGVILAAEADAKTGGGRIALDGTVFYPEGGGQPADRGTLTLADGTVLNVTDVHETNGINKAAIIRHSKKAYVVAEARKLSTDGNYNYTTLDTLSGLITDSEPAADIRAAADSYGVEIILP